MKFKVKLRDLVFLLLESIGCDNVAELSRRLDNKSVSIPAGMNLSICSPFELEGVV